MTKAWRSPRQLGRALAKSQNPEDRQKAIPVLEKAYEANPKSCEVAGALGKLYFEQRPTPDLENARIRRLVHSLSAWIASLRPDLASFFFGSHRRAALREALGVLRPDIPGCDHDEFRQCNWRSLSWSVLGPGRAGARALPHRVY